MARKKNSNDKMSGVKLFGMICLAIFCAVFTVLVINI